MELRDPAERLACYDRMALAVVELGLTVPGTGVAAAAAGTTGVAAEDSAAPRPDAHAGSAAEDFGREQQQAQKEMQSMTARVVGGFRGWSGDTVFELDNGQVWQQTGSGRYEYSGEDRAVVISRGFLGSFSLRPEGLNRTVHVKRTK